MKAKISIKKALSLIVALVMLLTMIPMGMVSVSAAEPTIDLSNYDEADEYVIMNEADWFLIAESNKDFEGIVIKLGADLDMAAYTEPLYPDRVTSAAECNPKPNGARPTNASRVAYLAATIPTLFKTFAGEFDGQNYTIKNAKVEEALIAAVTLDGAEIKNLKIQNIQASDLYDYLNFGIVVGEAKGSLSIENVHLSDCYLRGASDDPTNFTFGPHGGFVGMADAAAEITDAFLEISNCSITNSRDRSTQSRTEMVGHHYGSALGVGAVKPNFDVEIDQITIKNCDGKSYEQTFGGLIGMLHVGPERSAEITNITVEGLSLLDSRPTVSDRNQCIGTVIGMISPYDNAYVEIDKITVKDSKAETWSGSAGAVIGGIMNVGTEGTATQLDLRATGTVGAEINISNIYTTGTAISYGTQNAEANGLPCRPYRNGAGGLIGVVGAPISSLEAAQGNFLRADINIFGCYIGSTVMAGVLNTAFEPDLTIYDQGAGGVFGQVTASATVINLENTVIDAKFPTNQIFADPALYPDLNSDDAAKKQEAQNAYSMDQATSIGLIAYAARSTVKSMPGYGATDSVPNEFKPSNIDGYYEVYINTKNVSTTMFGDYYLIALTNLAGGVTYNDTEIGGGSEAPSSGQLTKTLNTAYTDDSIPAVRPAVAKQMVSFDEDGFVDDVVGTIVTPANIQVSAVNDGKVDIRFIALCYVDEITEASAIINAKKDGNVIKVFEAEDVELYDSLDAVAGLDAYSAKEYGAKKFMAVTIKNVPLAEANGFDWSFAYVTEGGIEVNGDTVSGTLAADGTFTVTR